MTLYLTEDQSLEYLEGGWDQYALEDLIELELAVQGVREPVAVVLADVSAVVFFLFGGWVYHG